MRPQNPHSATVVKDLCSKGGVFGKILSGRISRNQREVSRRGMRTINGGMWKKGQYTARRKKVKGGKSVVPMKVDLKEITEMQGKTFAKFDLKFKNMNVLRKKPSIFAKTVVSEFRCKDSKQEKKKSPENSELIAAGFKAVLPLIKPCTKTFLKTKIKLEKKVKLNISLHDISKTKKPTLKRFWSPVNLTTCEFLEPMP